MNITLPDNIVGMALEAFFIQQGGSINSTEGRSLEVERREKYIAEIVCGIVANTYRKQKLLPYGNRKPTE